MTPPSQVVDETARAVLDGTPVDWPGLETSVDDETRGLVAQLQVLAAVADVHREAEPGPVTWGHLRVLERVGAGASGTVYRAWDTRLDREVALKLIPAPLAPGDAASPIIEEGRLLARVRHPNVATIYGAEALDGQVGLWMEFVRGQTLEQLLRSGHQFTPSQVIDIGIDLCRAVSAVHAAGLLHRDIKTQNVMRADDGRLVLTDFGAGRDLTGGSARTAGTPLYLAPEVLAGAPPSIRTDVYSIGVLLFRLLSGRYPVRATTLEELRTAHAAGVGDNLATLRPDLPAALLAIVRVATDPDPARRCPSCDALASDLRRCDGRGGRRRRTTALLAAAAVAGAAWLAVPGAVSDTSGSGALAGRLGTFFGLTRPAAAAAPVVVVVPFRNLRSDADSELLVDGLTYELIRNLSMLDGLLVRSASTSFALKDRNLSLAAIGHEFGATVVIEGSVSGSGDQIRVQAQLASVAGDTPLWTDKFDRHLTDVLAIQDDIARAVANELRLTLDAGQRRYDLVPDVQAMYLRARALTERRSSESAQQAVDLYQAVLARDPGFAPAHAGLCDAYHFWSQSLPDVLGLPHQEALELMRAAALAALDLDPLLAESHAAMGLLAAREHDWAAADAAFRRAIELNPSLLHVYTSYSISTLIPLGRFVEDEALLLEALRRDPAATDVQRELGALYLTSGRYEEAIEIFERLVTTVPDLTFVPMLLARAQSLAGRVGEAMPYWESVSATVGSQHWMAYAFVRAGRRAEIEGLVQQPQHAYRLALFQAALGNVDEALDALAEAAEIAPHRTVRLLIYPELAHLRGHPRFEAIRARFGLP